MCAMPEVLRTSCRNGVLIIPKSAPLLNPADVLAVPRGTPLGLSAPKRPVSVMARNLWGIPDTYAQVLFFYLPVYYKGGVAKSYEA